MQDEQYRSVFRVLKLKETIEIAQAVATILAIIIGGLWTYNIFIKERQDYPHANIEQSIEHISLSNKTNLLHVTVALTNNGSSRLLIKKSFIRIQQILPIPFCIPNNPCAEKQIDTALTEKQRNEDIFTWSLISERNKIFKIPLDIEPGEKDTIDFEFALQSSIKTIRVYSYFKNEVKSTPNRELGWRLSKYYSFENASNLN